MNICKRISPLFQQYSLTINLRSYTLLIKYKIYTKINFILKKNNSHVGIVDHIEFRQGLPFYEMVMSFTISLSTFSVILNKDKLINLKEKDYFSLEGIWVESKHFFPYDVIKNIQSGKFTFPFYINSCCCMLANTAYEAVKDMNDKSPEFEYFRHIRNASSHQNMFNFVAYEPNRPAHWKKSTIDHNLKGNQNPLYGTACFGTFVGVADIIDLLKEIEKNLFN